MNERIIIKQLNSNDLTRVLRHKRTSVWLKNARYKRPCHIRAYRALPLETVVGVTVRCLPNVAGFVVPAHGITTISINYFKPAAGLIVLIFVLFIAFRLFEEHMEEKRLTELRAQRAEEKRQYEECVSGVDAVKRFDEDLARLTLAEARNNGSFNQMMQSCLASTFTPTSSYGGDRNNFNANMQKISEQKCEVEVVMNILTYPLSLDPDSVDSKHAAGVMECKSKYNIE